ncbi:MAG: hypothetical protein C0518_10200 [Opitutus sp.]|nr:hypothetical protein [Opitutus sp.]
MPPMKSFALFFSPRRHERSAACRIARGLTVVLLFTTALATSSSAQEKASEAGVIYPRAAGEAAAPSAAGKGGSSNVVLIGFALVAAGAGGWLLWRQKNSPAGLGATARKLAIAETRPLGNRQYLVVADYDGRKFLLGVCPGRIEMLTPLGEGDDDAEAT